MNTTDALRELTRRVCNAWPHWRDYEVVRAARAALKEPTPGFRNLTKEEARQMDAPYPPETGYGEPDARDAPRAPLGDELEAYMNDWVREYPEQTIAKEWVALKESVTALRAQLRDRPTREQALEAMGCWQATGISGMDLAQHESADLCLDAVLAKRTEQGEGVVAEIAKRTAGDGREAGSSPAHPSPSYSPPEPAPTHRNKQQASMWRARCRWYEAECERLREAVKEAARTKTVGSIVRPVPILEAEEPPQ